MNLEQVICVVRPVSLTIILAFVRVGVSDNRDITGDNVRLDSFNAFFVSILAGLQLTFDIHSSTDTSGR